MCPSSTRTALRSKPKLIHNVPASRDAGNMYCLSFEEQAALAAAKRELKIRPKDEALKRHIRENMGYQGPLAHRGGVHAITYNPLKRQILSAGGDGTLSMWQVDRLDPGKPTYNIPTCGEFGSAGDPVDVAALAASRALGYLDAPVQMITAPHTPVPFSPPLEDYYVPKADAIVEAVRAIT